MSEELAKAEQARTLARLQILTLAALRDAGAAGMPAAELAAALEVDTAEAVACLKTLHDKRLVDPVPHDGLEIRMRYGMLPGWWEKAIAR